MKFDKWVIYLIVWSFSMATQHCLSVLIICSSIFQPINRTIYHFKSINSTIYHFKSKNSAINHFKCVFNTIILQKYFSLWHIDRTQAVYFHWPTFHSKSWIICIWWPPPPHTHTPKQWTYMYLISQEKSQLQVSIEHTIV